MVSLADAKDALLSIPSVESLEDISYVDEGINTIYNAKIKTQNGTEEVYAKFRDVAPADSFRAAPLASEYVRQNTEVQTPEVFHMDWTNSVVDTNWYVMRAADNTNQLSDSNLTGQEKLDALRVAGEELGKLHRDSIATGYGDFRVSEQGEMFYDGSSWSEWVADLARRTYDGRETEFFEEQKPVIMEAIDSITAVVPNEPPSKVLHADYWPANFFYSDDYTSISTVIDWDWVIGGDPLFDLAVSEYLCTSHLDETEVLSFREGYTNNTSVSMESTVFNSPRYDAYRLTVSFREMSAFNHWYKAHSEEKTQEAADWVTEYTESIAKSILNQTK